MKAANLSATRTAIAAAEVFEMQDQESRTLGIPGELVLRMWVPARARQIVANLRRQATDVLGVPSGVREMQGATTSGYR